MNDSSVDFEVDLMDMLDSMGDKLSPEGRIVYHCSMDDFGTCEKHGVRGFAGYVAQKDSWNRFNGRWDEVLNQYGLDYLHTADFLHNYPLVLLAEKPRTDEDDYNILKPFIRVIREELINPGGFGIVVVTECAAHAALSAEEKRWVRPPGRNSLEMLIGGVCNHISPELGRHNPIAFEVDESDVARNLLTILQTYVELKKQNDLYKKSLGAITFADDRMLRALQAADLLGNLALKAWRRQKEDKAWPKAAILAIAKDEKVVPAYARSYDESKLREIANARKARGGKSMLLSDLDI